MTAFVVRVWLPDRPGALGAVASRVGAVGGDVVGIEILERGTGRAVDEVVVDLADPSLVSLLRGEIEQVDGVSVEEIRELPPGPHDPRLEGLEAAVRLVATASPGEALNALCTEAADSVAATWAAVVSLDGGDVVTGLGPVPDAAWLVAYLAGTRTDPQAPAGGAMTGDVVWAPLLSARAALVLGRDGVAFRARERHQVSALARIVDARHGELHLVRSLAAHPARGALSSPR